jgi:hypothetical protein
VARLDLKLSLVTAMLIFVRELFGALTALDLSIDP